MRFCIRTVPAAVAGREIKATAYLLFFSSLSVSVSLRYTLSRVISLRGAAREDIVFAIGFLQGARATPIMRLSLSSFSFSSSLFGSFQLLLFSGFPRARVGGEWILRIYAGLTIIALAGSRKNSRLLQSREAARYVHLRACVCIIYERDALLDVVTPFSSVFLLYSRASNFAVEKCFFFAFITFVASFCALCYINFWNRCAAYSCCAMAASTAVVSE